MVVIKKKNYSATPQALCISIYEEMSTQLIDIAKELGVHLDTFDGGILSDGHHYAQKMQDQYDVIISQAGTATAIQSLVQTPLVTVNITTQDIIHAFEQALTHGKSITFICHQGDLVNEVEAMAKLLAPDNFYSLSYGTKEEFEECIQGILNNKNHVVMGFGGCVIDIAKQHGIPYIHIKSNEKNLYRAMYTAKNIIEKNIYEKRRARRLQNLINHNREGIISIDKNHMITICNAEAQRMLKLKNLRILGTHVHSKDTPESLRTLYGNGKFILNSPLEINNTIYVVSRIPVIVRSRVQETVMTFQALRQIQRVEAKARAQIHAKGLVTRYSFKDILYSSKAMDCVITKAKQYAGTHANVLIEGETGTGKELMAQSIHKASPRRNGPFVAINCAALPAHLLESELFGYEEGAFTGAKKGGKSGLFELADKGTIFLDEIGEMPLDIQGKLLRVLQEKEVFRLGGDKVTNIDVRVISATNKNLFDMVEKNAFRRDLFFRLNLLLIYIPPLRDRLDDIPLLTHHFIEKYGAEYNTLPPLPTENTCNQLKKYSWQGNIRELINLIERACIVYHQGQNIDTVLCQELESHFMLLQRSQKSLHAGNSTALTIPCGTLKEMEQEILRILFKRTQGKTQEVADMLGISRVTIWKKMKELHEEYSQQ